MKKTTNFVLAGVLIALLASNPILVHAEEEFFPSATSTVSVSTTIQSNDSETAGVMAKLTERQLVPEHAIRVGLYKTAAPVVFEASTTYELWVGDVSRGVVMPGEKIELRYAAGTYSIKSENIEFGTDKYIRLVPQQEGSVFTLSSYIRTVKGRGNINFNVYRGILEYRYSPKSKLPYVINELPLDLYVRGVAETHDGAASEYLKALAVAVRSYGNAFIVSEPPTEKRMFDVFATTADQLYLGYNSELSMPNFVSAANETAGEMVLYDGRPVITFYFSHSNGRTKNAGKARPWLKSVDAKYDKGKKMLGHGIGMSNADAQLRALKDGWRYTQILEHYYTSTTVERVF